ncbi:Endoglucanase 2 [Spatholobus suberectus]|nr:Endoglucanase 2 [Spatholobus suberectus]
MEHKVGLGEPNKKPYVSALWWWLTVSIIAVLVVGTGVLSLITKFGHSDSAQFTTRPTNVVQKYASALELALQFFDVQKSGKLENNRVWWRGDSGLRDGSEADLDLSKGMYDAGDHMKFGFPMAFTATVLSWAILEYGDHMDAVKQLHYALDSLKWITDYLINAHPFPEVLYIQVGDPEVDHNCWERPEDMNEERPLTQVNSSFPGTEVAAETAAALASASLVFKEIDFTYSEVLLGHAQQLFIFADTYRVSYSVSIPQVGKYYNSSGYGDELLWAGTWLYHATKDPSYLNYVTEQNEKAFGSLGSLSWFSWDDKHAATQVPSMMQCFLFERYQILTSPLDEQTNKTGGLIWVVPWNSLQHSVASAFLAVLYSDYMLTSQTETLYCSGELYKPADLRKFAISQVDYVLGENPMKMSYLVGYGTHYPEYIHHRGSSIPVNATTGCRDGFKLWFDSPHPNPNVAFGALVGGPFFNETYNDFRNNSMQAEPTTYSSALFVALLSGLVASSSVVWSF